MFIHSFISYHCLFRIYFPYSIAFGAFFLVVPELFSWDYAGRPCDKFYFIVRITNNFPISFFPDNCRYPWIAHNQKTQKSTKPCISFD